MGGTPPTRPKRLTQTRELWEWRAETDLFSTRHSLHTRRWLLGLGGRALVCATNHRLAAIGWNLLQVRDNHAPLACNSACAFAANSGRSGSSSLRTKNNHDPNGVAATGPRWGGEKCARARRPWVAGTSTALTPAPHASNTEYGRRVHHSIATSLLVRGSGGDARAVGVWRSARPWCDKVCYSKHVNHVTVNTTKLYSHSQGSHGHPFEWWVWGAGR